MPTPMPKFLSGLQEGGKSHRVAVWYLQEMRLKIRDSLTGKVAKRYLNVCERVEVVEKNKWSLLFSCCPVYCQCLWKKTKTKNKKKQKKQNYKLIFCLIDQSKNRPNSLISINKKSYLFLSHLKYRKLKLGRKHTTLFLFAVCYYRCQEKIPSEKAPGVGSGVGSGLG